MPKDARGDILQNLYALYDRFCAEFAAACHKGCAHCCTANVTLTTLEASLIIDYWSCPGQPGAPLDALRATVARPHFQPILTINQVAEYCVRGLDIPDEAADPSAGPCPLLKDRLCSIYSVRPFGCRAMHSQSDCAGEGAAEMPEWLLAANNLMLQYVEGLDAQGVTGNLSALLLLLSQPQPAAAPAGMPANRSIPVLMIPPDLRQRLDPLLRGIQRMFRSPC
ncbi:MAG: hypothetical protein VR64_19765 [Desulfatitalea sp. BRH_c12]|nr:MAG: hypothetical protein VR64_19765 [Desulfatitalea sp. BRH_c12]